MNRAIRKSMIERFYRYVRIDTQSSEDAGDRYPSTEKQKDLARILVKELHQLGLEDAEMDEYGYVMATYPSRCNRDGVPVLGLLAHLDTSPEVSGQDVKPVLHEAYKGGDLILPNGVSIKAKENPELKKYIGRDIITSSGDTLLGADNKAGIAEIITLIEVLNQSPELEHGPLRIGFTPDEEIGRGTRFFDLDRFGADFAYTVDGEKAGDVENETFNAALATFTVQGINLHPGYAKGKLVNAIRITADLIEALKSEPAPETTEQREGFLHPYTLEGGVEQAVLKILIRDFEIEEIQSKAERLNAIRMKVISHYPGADLKLEVEEQYRNMRMKLDEDRRVVDYALEAVSRAGLQPNLHRIRGGTDGARLSYKGLLTPNLFTGGMNFHSKQEWIAVDAMEKAVETLMHLVQIWKERSIAGQ